MKRGLFVGAFVFSIALNLAVATTVAWRVWWNPDRPKFPSEGYQALSPRDFEEIRRMSHDGGAMSIRRKRRLVREKRMEIIDMLSRDPGNLTAVEKPLHELTSLRSEADRSAVARLSRVMSRLSEEKRASFAAFLKNRPFMGPGMGPGHGPGACPPPR